MKDDRLEALLETAEETDTYRGMEWRTKHGVSFCGAYRVLHSPNTRWHLWWANTRLAYDLASAEEARAVAARHEEKLLSANPPTPFWTRP
jgi:hypothetical protein